MEVNKDGYILASSMQLEEDNYNNGNSTFSNLGKYDILHRFLSGFIQHLTEGNNNTSVKIVIGYDEELCSAETVDFVLGFIAANNIEVFLHRELHTAVQLSFGVRLFSAQAGIMITSRKTENVDVLRVCDQYGIQQPLETYKYPGSIDRPFNMAPHKSFGAIKEMGNEIDLVFYKTILRYFSQISTARRSSEILYIDYWGNKISLLSKSLQRFDESVSIINNGITSSYQLYPYAYSTQAVTEEIIKELGIKNIGMIIGSNRIEDELEVFVYDDLGQLIKLDYAQLSAMSFYYYLLQRHRANALTGVEFVTCSYFTSELTELIAKAFDVDCYKTTGGFEQLKDLVKLHRGQKEFIIGAHDKDGIVVGDLARGKDTISMALLFIKLGEWVQYRDQTIFDFLIDIYLEFGFYKEKTSYLSLGNVSSQLVDLIKADIPLKFDFAKVRSHQFVATGNAHQDLIEFVLADRSKIKIYAPADKTFITIQIIVKTELSSKAEYHQSNLILQSRLHSLTDSVETYIRKTMGNSAPTEGEEPIQKTA